MPTVAFWNLGQRPLADTVVEFLWENGVDILITAEPGFDSAELIVAHAKATGKSLFTQETIPSRLRYYSVFSEDRFRSVSDDAYVSIKEYNPAFGGPLLLAGVHLPSKLHERDHDQPFGAVRLVQRIRDAEKLVGHDRTLVIGDFNMNPFEPGMVACDALHSVMDRRIAAKLSRTVKGEERQFFYNPMWKVMGDWHSEALGTYYRRSSSQVALFWETFDQVLLRPSLLSEFRDADLQIIQKIGNQSLLSETGLGLARHFSDHLPILLKLKDKL